MWVNTNIFVVFFRYVNCRRDSYKLMDLILQARSATFHNICWMQIYICPLTNMCIETISNSQAIANVKWNKWRHAILARLGLLKNLRRGRRIRNRCFGWNQILKIVFFKLPPLSMSTVCSSLFRSDYVNGPHKVWKWVSLIKKIRIEVLSLLAHSLDIIIHEGE